MWVPKHLATMPILLKVYDGLDENGGKHFTKEIETKAAVFNDFSTVYTNEGEKRQLVAKAYIFEKLDELESNMQAVCKIQGKEYLVHHTSKKYDMNNKPNHFEMELM